MTRFEVMENVVKALASAYAEQMVTALMKGQTFIYSWEVPMLLQIAESAMDKLLNQAFVPDDLQKAKQLLTEVQGKDTSIVTADDIHGILVAFTGPND